MMMDMTPFLTKLNHLETGTLKVIQAHIETLMKGRFDTTIRPGRTATFVGKDRLTHYCRIDQMNRTTVSVTEISPESGKKWRVGVGMLKVDGVERTVAMVPKMPVTRHVPTTTGDGW